MGSIQPETDKVKASVLHGIKDLRIETRELPPPLPNEVQVAVKSTGLCGSDLHYFNHYRNGDIIVREPMSLGHESSGVVFSVGSSVTHLQVGDKVALEVGLPCGNCELCEEGRYNICKGMRFRSSAKAFPHFQGTLQEKINHPAAWCHKLPADFSFHLGALLEPLGVAIHASKRASLKKGSTILVFGAGAVGLLCAAMAVVNGAGRVVIADIQPDRVKFATANKFAHAGFVVPLSSTPPAAQTIQEKLAHATKISEVAKGIQVEGSEATGEVDAVFECTGVESCLQAAIYSTKPGGRIMLVGMGNPIQTLPISAAALREVDLIGVFRYAGTYKSAIEIVSSGNPLLPDLRTLLTQRFSGMDDIPKAFEMAGQVKDGDGNLVLKVVVDMGS